jgi:predicted RNA methylase
VELAKLMSQGLNKGAELLGVDEETRKKYVAPSAFSTEPQVGDTASITRGIEHLTGSKLPTYEAKTLVGKLVGTGLEFAPNILFGPGGLLRRAVTNVAAPAAASEVAGAATEGTAAEPWARAAAAFAAGVGSHKALPGARRLPTGEQIDDAAAAGFKAARASGVDIDPNAVASLGASIKQKLDIDGLSDVTAKDVHKILDRVTNPPAGSVSTIGNLHTLRKELQLQAGKTVDFKPTENAKAATRALEDLDGFLSNIPQAAVLRGDAAAASKLLRDAITNTSSARTLDRVDRLTQTAANNAEAANSGQNLLNAEKAQIKAVLNQERKQRGFTEPELAQLQRALGSGRTLRSAGNLLRTMQGVGLSGAAGFLGGFGPWGAVAAAAAAPVLGQGLKGLATRAQHGQLDKLDKMIRGRSALAQTMSGKERAFTPGLLALLQASSRLRDSSSD